MAAREIDGHKDGHTNRWAIAGRHVDSLRSTDNPVNTPYQQGVTFDNYGNPCNGAFGSRHVGGAVFAFADGSVHFIQENIDLNLYRTLGQRGSGKTVYLRAFNFGRGSALLLSDDAFSGRAWQLA